MRGGLDDVNMCVSCELRKWKLWRGKLNEPKKDASLREEALTEEALTGAPSNRRGFYLVKGLPFRYATKVLEKFRLRTDSPKTFVYAKIRDYLTKRLEVKEGARMLNPAEAVKDFVNGTN
ncbi:hypothetical protein EJ02DRAFT_458409 [Clathrospora elynae]|uniref:Uncharacterized protein n=1 Tax=Clathrospora elynae TaxID=706981 RepID=A0A6A5SDL4_9PLEO|nr:hypothetical protein EJ02DRAFT_458409 [Clathrospora elynae]